MGHEQMEDGEPFCLLAQAVSEQHDQWWQDYWQRSDAHQQSGYDSVKDVGQIVTAERQLFGSAVPPIAKSARGTCGNQSHGSQAGPFGVPHVAPWDEIRGQRSRGLRVPTPPASNQLSQAESRHARIPGHRTSRSLSAKVSGVSGEKGAIAPNIAPKTADVLDAVADISAIFPHPTEGKVPNRAGSCPEAVGVRRHMDFDNSSFVHGHVRKRLEDAIFVLCRDDHGFLTKSSAPKMLVETSGCSL